jgi:hypothetical protein
MSARITAIREERANNSLNLPARHARAGVVAAAQQFKGVGFQINNSQN